MLRRRHRTGPYPLAQSGGNARPIVGIASVIIVALLFLWAARAVLSVFDFGNSIERMSTMLSMDNRGAASVTLAGESPRSADTSLKLYPGDGVTTDRGVSAHLSFFDGTIVRLGKGTSITIEESARGSVRSTLTLRGDRGAVWMHTPQSIAFSGSITRDISLPLYTANVPAGTEALFTQNTVEIYHAEGIGVTLTLPQAKTSIIVSEGQKYSIPEKPVEGEDLYIHRTVLGTHADPGSFVRSSRGHLLRSPENTTGASSSTSPSAILTVTRPKDQESISNATIAVQGSVGPTVVAVRVNGYKAALDTVLRTFSIDIAPPDGGNVILTIEALGADNTVLEKTIRTVTRDWQAPAKPSITSPAVDGSLYRTTKSEIEIRGRAPRGTAGIIINDYRLQLFSVGDEEWSYLASTKLGNFSVGDNVFTVVALGERGAKSDPVTLTIRLGNEGEGVVSAGAPSSSLSSSSSLEESSLPKNPPLQPGTLTVSAPTPGTRHEGELTASGAEFLIEGLVPAETRTMWVNDYQLKLFASGKGFFNYIASTKLNTLKRGENPYVIIARDKNNQILDQLTYTIVLRRSAP